MTLSVRLESSLERRLLDYSTQQGVSKSEVVKQSLEAFLAQKSPKKTAWELGKHLFGRHDVEAPSDLAVNHSQHYADALAEKHLRDQQRWLEELRDLAANHKKYLTEALLEKHHRRRGSKLQVDAAHLPPGSAYALKPAEEPAPVKAVRSPGKRALSAASPKQKVAA